MMNFLETVNLPPNVTVMYTMFQKTSAFYFFNNSARSQSVLVNFSIRHHEETCYK